MLVLSRKKDEQVIITAAGKEVVVTVTDLGSDKVRLGFAADPDVTIHRREVQEQIERERRRGR